MTYIEKARLEQAIAELSDAEFDDVVARTRPPRVDYSVNDDVKAAILAGLNRDPKKAI